MVLSEDSNDVVISGIGGYFPKSRNIEEFQELLFKQEHCMENARWETENFNSCDMTGNVNQINFFDSSYFGIHRQQTLFMDPLTRMALQNTFEAIIDAGVNPTEIRGQRIAVIMGSTLSENDSLMFESVENGYGVTGQARCMLANRISYWLHAIGPSFSSDHSWVGGLQVLQNGYNLIKSGEYDGVIVGAVNLTMNIFPHYLYKTLKFISPDGKTKSFDENANGYTRSDALVILFLQRADIAKRNYATILGVDVLFNGNRSGQLSKFNIDNARNFLTNFYQKINIDPSSVPYVETYGAAIKILDEFEIDLIDQVFNRNKTKSDQPLLVGSVKSNIGHSEAAASLVAIIKTIIAMESGKIPGNIDLEEPNTKIKALKDGRIKVVTENTPWTGSLAAINAFGLVSSYGHLLLKANEVTDKNDNENILPHLYVLSTRTEDGIREIIDKVKSYPTLNMNYMNIINETFSSSIPGHLYRGYLVRNSNDVSYEEISHFNGLNRPIWFVYSGMGSQWLTMGKSLLQLPIFAEAIAKCHATLEPHGIDLYRILTSDEDPEIFNNILHSFVGIAAIQIGLTDVLHALGFKPDNIIGHSVGELGCAYADGCLTAEQMILSAYYRGKASLEVELEPGLMAAVGLGAKKMKEHCPANVDIACRNGPDSCTISGPKDTMQELVEKLQASGIFARLINVAGIAYHSRYIKPAAPLLLNYLKDLIPNPIERSPKWLSSSVPEANGGWNTKTAKYASAEYLTNNLLSAVCFEEVLEHVPKDAILIEIAPHGLLQAILKRSVHQDCINVALTKRGEENGIDYFLSAIGKLYLAGYQMNIPNLYKTSSELKENNLRHKVLPRGTPSLAPLVRWSHKETWRTGIDEFKDKSCSEQSYNLDKNSEMFHDLNGHRIRGVTNDNSSIGSIIVPVTTYLPLICNILSNIRRLGHIIFEDVHMIRHRSLPDAINIYVPPVNIMVQRGTGKFEVSDRFGIVTTGRYSSPSDQEFLTLTNVMDQQYNLGNKTDELTSEELYREFSSRGCLFQGAFQSIHHLEIFENGMKAKIEWKNGWQMFVSAMLQLTIFKEHKKTSNILDAVFFQSLSVTFNEQKTPNERSLVDVIYNYSTDSIISPIIQLHGPKCRPYQIEPKHLIADKCYVATKKSNKKNNKFKVIKINENSLSTSDLKSNVSWVTELYEALNNDMFERVYLISRVLPINSIDNFLANIHLLDNGNRVHLVFILDSNAPNNDTFYESVFNQNDSNISVYRSGVWEHKYTISSKLEDQYCLNKDLNSVLSDQHIRNNFPAVDTQYVGINPMNMVPDITEPTRKLGILSVLTEFTSDFKRSENKLGAIDYSGIEKKSNKHIMGIAHIDKSNKFSPDPILRWEIPEHWTLLEGVTAPFAYAFAYYVLDELVGLEAGESILIHNGCSSIGQAMIRVAFSRGCVIYTSVATAKQRGVLLNHMRMLRNESILDYTSNYFERDIMNATQGAGVRVLINCLPTDKTKAGLRCVDRLSRVALIQDENQSIEKYTDFIGLSIFLRCTGMYGVKVSKIFELPNDTKKRIHQHVLTGLQKKQIFPIKRIVLRSHDNINLNEIFSYMTGPKVTGTVILPLKGTEKENIVSKNGLSYIIYNNINPENIIKTINWLASKYNTQKIITLTSFTNNIDKKYVLRSLSNLRSNYPGVWIEIIEVPPNKPETGLRKLIQRNESNISAGIIFSNSTSNDLLFIQQLKDKFKNIKIAFVNCVSTINQMNIERYINANIKNVSFLRWNKKRSFEDAIGFLEQALEETVDIYVRKDGVNEENDDIEIDFSYKDFFNLLGSSVCSLSKLNLPKEEITIELKTTSCPRNFTECPPVFIIPGLFGAQCNYLQATLKHLMSPAYIIDSSYDNISLDQLAIKIAKKIRSIYPDGPYNIIGVSTGGVLALEVTKYFESEIDAKVQLYLIDGAPDTLQDLISEAIEDFDSNVENIYEIILLKYLLNIKDSKILSELLTAPAQWNTRVKIALGQRNKHLEQVLTCIKRKFDVVLNYSTGDSVLNTITRLLKPNESKKDTAKLRKLCKQVKIEVIKGNHFTIMQVKNMATYINNHILYQQIYT